MSRRDSRASLNVRQNDALTEFENFKKRFLLANKHITKLNSTLSVRIEELQSEISTLYVENLRLRASEIALATQLKKEQEKSRKVLAGAEAATSNLSKHLAFLRQSLNITHGAPSPTLDPKPPPKARKPVPDPNASPLMPRLSRAPNFPGIYEDEEVASSADADEGDIAHVAPSARRKKDRLVIVLSLTIATSGGVATAIADASTCEPGGPRVVSKTENESKTERASFY
ncbi:hypothetical protein JVU11DRAFT_72 [Chiua virens]|nr:hypothetical protein JVU11DRAFT_72 [Chiua virens]